MFSILQVWKCMMDQHSNFDASCGFPSTAGSQLEQDRGPLRAVALTIFLSVFLVAWSFSFISPESAYGRHHAHRLNCHQTRHHRCSMHHRATIRHSVQPAPKPIAPPVVVAPQNVPAEQSFDFTEGQEATPAELIELERELAEQGEAEPPVDESCMGETICLEG